MTVKKRETMMSRGHIHQSSITHQRHVHYTWVKAGNAVGAIMFRATRHRSYARSGPGHLHIETLLYFQVFNVLVAVSSARRWLHILFSAFLHFHSPRYVHLCSSDIPISCIFVAINLLILHRHPQRPPPKSGMYACTPPCFINSRKAIVAY